MCLLINYMYQLLKLGINLMLVYFMLEKNTLENIVMQFYGQMQRIITFGHISPLLLSQKCKEINFSLLFLPFFHIPFTSQLTYRL